MARFPSGRLDRFHLLILDDLAYVTKDQAETSGAIRAYRQLRAQVHARHRQPAVRRMGQGPSRPDGFMMPPFLGASCVAREREVD